MVVTVLQICTMIKNTNVAWNANNVLVTGMVCTTLILVWDAVMLKTGRLKYLSWYPSFLSFFLTFQNLIFSASYLDTCEWKESFLTTSFTARAFGKSCKILRSSFSSCIYVFSSLIPSAHVTEVCGNAKRNLMLPPVRFTEILTSRRSTGNVTICSASVATSWLTIAITVTNPKSLKSSPRTLTVRMMDSVSLASVTSWST